MLQYVHMRLRSSWSDGLTIDTSDLHRSIAWARGVGGLVGAGQSRSAAGVHVTLRALPPRSAAESKVGLAPQAGGFLLMAAPQGALQRASI
jgi:hypothetical protein